MDPGESRGLSFEGGRRSLLFGLADGVRGVTLFQEKRLAFFTGLVFLTFPVLFFWLASTPRLKQTGPSTPSIESDPQDKPFLGSIVKVLQENPPSGVAVSLPYEGHQGTLPLSLLHLLETARTAVLSGPDTEEKEAELNRWIDQIVQSDPDRALDFLMESSSSDETRALSILLIQRWATKDPETAAAWIERCPEAFLRREAIDALAAVWAGGNLSNAVAWARHLPDSAERSSGLMAIAYEAARIQPEKALQLVNDWPASEIRNDLVIHAVNQWAASQPDAAAEWAIRIPDTDLRETVLANIAASWGESDPQTAATLARIGISPGKTQDNAVIGIMERWVQKDPERAAAWVASFPEGPLRREASQQLVRIWTDQDIGQPADWLSSLQPGLSRDKAFAAYAKKIMPKFPAVAAQWVESIDGEILRHREMEIIGEAWLQNDAPAARDWITQSHLPESVKMRLLTDPIRK